MRKVSVKDPPKAAINMTAGLERMVLFAIPWQPTIREGQTGKLSPDQLAKLKATFAHNGHPMFREALGAIRHATGEAPKNFAPRLEKADQDKLTRLVRLPPFSYR